MYNTNNIYIYIYMYIERDIMLIIIIIMITMITIINKYNNRFLGIALFQGKPMKKKAEQGQAVVENTEHDKDLTHNMHVRIYIYI